MNILILTIYNDTLEYNQMRQSQIKINIADNIDHFFITFNENITEDIAINHDNKIIYIKGKEHILNITHKTIKTLQYFLLNSEKHYDYIIRTNISTIINYSNLQIYLSNLPKNNVYIGGTLETLNWIDIKSGINIDSIKQFNLIGLKYIQGTSIILSNDVAKYIINNENIINHSIVDDVTIGLFIRENLHDIYSNLDSMLCAKVSYNNFDKDSVFIRNNSYHLRNLNANRILDIERIENIINYINFNNKQTNVVNYNDNIIQPKTIHLIHKKYELLEKSANCWRVLNPEYAVELYDDDRCMQILLEHFGQLHYNIFNFITDGSIKCDFFRLCVLYIFGGIYADADIKPYVPINEFIDEDLDFATCISYNYKPHNQIYNYNPHFVLVKKNNKYILDIINKYVEYYINKIEYKYSNWSICNLMTKIFDFDITSNGKNIFIHNNQKYKFFIETIHCTKTGDLFNFSNFNYANYKSNYEEKYAHIYCSCEGKIIFTNFENK